MEKREQKKAACLVLGNGINMLFQDVSWKQIIENELDKSKSQLKYEDIKDMPATMQIVAATGDHVSSRLKDLSNEMMKITMTTERESFLQNLISLPVDEVMTTNYSFEIEIAHGMKPDKRQYSARLTPTFVLQEKHRKFRLYQYYPLNEKRIWHIHGDAAKPDTMLMGHYYYAKQLRSIQDCVAKTIQRYKICEEKGEEFQSYSWVDQFLTGDVYILGLGMYLCEADLWYLLCCKKKNFPQTNTYFYDMTCSDKTIRIMLETYGAIVIDGNELGSSNEYMDFYISSMNDIRKKLMQQLLTR